MKSQTKTSKTKYRDVTIADVKACKGFEGTSDEEAGNIVNTIRVFTEVIYYCFQQGRFPEQNMVIPFSNDKSKHAA